MQYIIIALIILIVGSVLIKGLFSLIKMLFELIISFFMGMFGLIVEFVKAFPLLTFSILIVCIAFFADGWKKALLAVGLCVVLKILFTIIDKFSLINKKNRQNNFEKFLEKNYIGIGYVSRNNIMNQIPNKYKKGYPEGVSCEDMIDEFLLKQTEQAYQKLIVLLYGYIEYQGMDDIYSTRENVLSKFTGVSYSIKYEDLFDKAVDTLEYSKKIDRPTNDKNAIHFLGDTTNANNMKKTDYSNLVD